MSCPDYYLLQDGRQFDEFYVEECSPLVRTTLNDGQKHAIQSACEHLFRRGLKGDELDDVAKYRWWLFRVLTEYRDDHDRNNHEDHVERITRIIAPVVALVEFRRSQKIGNWKNLLPQVSNKDSKSELTLTAWWTVESFQPEE